MHNIYEQNFNMHGIISPIGYESIKNMQNYSTEKYDCNTTYQSSLNNTLIGK
jgi:hypothetical protein